MLLKETFVKAGTNVNVSDKKHEFAESISGVRQQQYKDFFYPYLMKCIKNSSDTIKKNSFGTPATNQKENNNRPQSIQNESQRILIS